MRRLLMFMILVVLGIAQLPMSVQAEADTCSCFCGNPGVGAYQPYTDPVTQTRCTEMCGDAGHSVLGCYTSRDQWPDKSEMCWTQTECAGMGAGYEWDNFVANCYDIPLPMGYCYSPQKAVTLLQPFDGNTTFTGIPEYVSAVYKYIVPVMAMIAVVMLMISGMQYILARGVVEQIKKAKSRITGAITGLILLMSAWTIANVLDPQLVNLKQLRIPTQKKVVLLDPDTTCEYLASVGYGISTTSGGTALYGENVKGACGVEGYVTDLTKVNSNVVAGSWEEGSKCKYRGCEAGAACMTDGCKTCVSTWGTIDNASPAVCAAFELTTKDTSNDEKLCKYFADPPVNAGDAMGPTCAQIDLNCKALRSEGGGCRDYDEMIARAGLFYNNGVERVMSASEFKTFCEYDYCGLAGGGRSCVVNSRAGSFDCVNGQDTLILDIEKVIQGGTCYNVNGDSIDEGYTCQSGS